MDNLSEERLNPSIEPIVCKKNPSCFMQELNPQPMIVTHIFAVFKIPIQCKQIKSGLTLAF